MIDRKAAWLRHLYDAFRERAQSNLVPEFDTFWENGWVEIPPRVDEYVLFADFRADPEKHKLRTPSGRIELYSDEIAGFGYDDCPPHPTWIGPAEWLGGREAGRFPLHLVSSQPQHKLHSQMDAGPVSARGKTAGRETLAINPADASERGIGDGEVVRVFNARGACFAGVAITDTVRPGVVRLSLAADVGRIVKTTGDGMLIEFSSVVAWPNGTRRCRSIPGSSSGSTFTRVTSSSRTEISSVTE